MTLKSGQLIDLSHLVAPGIPTWDLSCGFELTLASDYAADGFRIQHMQTPAGIGTHLDAPAHVCPGGRSSSQFSLAELLKPCVVIDVRAQSHAGYSVSVADIKHFERQYASLAPGCFVIIYSGWDRYWSTPARYHNDYQFPSVSIDAADYLLEKQIAGLGIDTLSADRPADGFPVHHLLLNHDKFLIENINNAGQMPPIGAQIFAVPLKIKDSTEVPIRLIGILP